MTWSPTRRYSAVAVMSQDLERVVLIHKLRPAWQAGKANLPGGKVETKDATAAMDFHVPFPMSQPWPQETFDALHLCCARRELREETGLDVAATALKLFAKLRFRTPEGDDAECCFYAVRGDVETALSMEEERVFTCDLDSFLFEGKAFYLRSDAEMLEDPKRGCWLPTMPNLPYLVAMARQCLRDGDGDTTVTWPLTVYENGAM